VIIVVGTPGSGKTTVLARATEGLGSQEVNYGDLMLEIAMSEKLVTHRDEMRKLPISKQKKLQNEVVKRLSEMKGRVILNTHAIVSTAAGYLPGLSYEMLRTVKPEQLILVVAPAKDVIRRRKEDTSRVRDQETAEQIQEIIDINKSYLFAYSAISGAQAAVVENADGKLEKAVEQVRHLLEARWG
jgi:adenylate kinase